MNTPPVPPPDPGQPSQQPPQQPAHLDPRFAINTGNGRCPQCGSTNIRVTQNTITTGNKHGCCVGCFLFVFMFPIWVYDKLANKQRTQAVGNSCQCLWCGHRWAG